MSACPPYARRITSACTMLCVSLAYACAGAPVSRTTDDPPDSGNIIPTPVDPVTAPFVAALPPDTTRTGIALRLLDADGASTTAEPPKAITQPLASGRAQALLEQLAGPAPAPAQRTSFRFPTSSLPAPRPGTTTRLSFSSENLAAPAASGAGPLRIAHASPRGEVATTSQISITFSQPMVELSSPPPAPAGVRITPEIRGAWRWLDPGTLVYEADGEFPAATRYTVSVPAGLRAASGAALAQPLEWTFATPAPGVRDVVALESLDPSGPYVIIVFDQRVDPAAVLPLLRLEVNGRDIALRSATAAELAQPMVAARIRTAPEGAVVVRPTGTIDSNDAQNFVMARLHIAAGVASLEGPLRSPQPVVHEFRMQRTFSVLEHACGRVDACIPGVPWTIRFTQPVRAVVDTASWVRIEPALPGATIQVWWDHIVILGSPRPNTTYTVHLDSTIATNRGARLGVVPPLRFTIGAPAASLWSPGGTLAALTGDARVLPLLVQGTDAVAVEVRAVSPSDWAAFMTYLVERRYTSAPASALPGRVLFKRNVAVTAATQGPGEARIDLARALDDTGHLIVLASASGDTAAHTVLTWVQKGDIQLDVAEHGEALTVRATDAAGRPLRDIQLQLHATAVASPTMPDALATSRTDQNGVATIDASYDRRGQSWLLIATGAGRSAVFGARGSADYESAPAWEWSARLRHHLVMDRSIYAPGDTVRFAGWLRRAAGTGHELALPAAQHVTFTAQDPRGAELATDTIDIRSNGRVEGSFVIPPEANAGRGRITLLLHEDKVELRTSAMYEIQAVRRPNFDVAMAIDAGPYLPGSRVDATLTAHYFTGGGVPNAETRWLVRSGFASYTPPGVVDYSFGMLRNPPQRAHDPVTRVTRTDGGGTQRLSVALDSVRPHRAMQLIVQATVTDIDRQGRSASQVLLVHPAAVYVGLRTATRFVRAGDPVIIDARVVDIEGRVAAGRPIVMRAMRQHPRMEAGRLVVDESERGRCTLQSSTGSVRCVIEALPAGDYIVVADVTDAQGRASTSELAVRIAGETIPARAQNARDSVAVTADRAVYEPGDTAHVLIETSLLSGAALLSLRRAGVLETHAVRIANGIATLALPVRDRHVPNMTLHASVIAPDGRTADGSTSVSITPVTRRLTVVVNPEAPQVAPGAATSVTVIVRDDAGRPVPNAQVVLSGIDEALLALALRKPGDPVSELYPHSGAAVFDRSLRVHSIRPFATRGGIINGVVIDAITGRPLRGVWVETSNGAGAWTGTDGRYQIDGVPAGRHVVHARLSGYVSASVGSVILSRDGAARAHFAMLTQYAALSAARGGDLEQLRREADFLGRGAELNELVAVAAAPPPPAAPGMEPVLRTVFTPVAAFVTDARTGADGSVTIPVNVPHSLTRYRLRAVAAHSERRFGAGESTLTARRPLMVRAMPPRFLNRDDRFAFTVLVENRSDAVQDVEIAVRAVNARLTGPTGQRVRVPAGDRVEVRFDAVAGEPGRATFQVAASGGTADAAEVTVPVLLPAVTETFAVYGHIDDARAVSYPLRLPIGSLPDQTRVDIGFSTTAVQGLRDALLFLIDCWFDLPEVSASRILALSALRDAPAASPWPVAAIDTMIRMDITRLARAQLLNGGWSVWAARFDADPFISVHAAHALARAHALGHVVPARTLANATRFLEQLNPIQATPEQSGGPMPRFAFPAEYPLQARHAVQAYALDVRRRLGHDVAQPAATLLRAAGVNALPAEALAWLLPALARDARFANDAAEIRRELDARMVRSAGTAAVVSPYNAGAREMLYSPRRTDAVVLAALIESGNASDELIAAMARGLMAHRVRGRWSNTQENAFAVAALADYLAAGEATEPALTARAWTGTRLAAQHDFRGRSDDRAELMVPADSIGEPGTTANVIMSREGAGRVYYRVALQHALAGLTPPLSRGFAVTRSYEAVDDPGDVQRDSAGNWRVRLGARVRVRVTVDNSGPRYHVALVDALPAGFEAVNPALAGTAASRPPVAVGNSPDRAPYLAEHVNVRADRFEAFRSRLNPGRYELTYIAIATTPGDFAAPAPRAEEMYAPETFGRGAATRVIVEQR